MLHKATDLLNFESHTVELFNIKGCVAENLDFNWNDKDDNYYSWMLAATCMYLNQIWMILKDRLYNNNKNKNQHKDMHNNFSLENDSRSIYYLRNQ